MKVVRIPITDAPSFDSRLKDILASAPGRVFVILYGSEDAAANNESWCPDCRTSDPLIRRAILAVPDSILVECPAGDRPTWRAPGNPYRVHAKLQATSVPTLYEFGKDGNIIKKLVENEITEVSLGLFVKP